MKRFRTLTRGHPVIMGRNTWESLPLRPLPGRKNIVITRDGTYQTPEGVVVATSLPQALAIAQETGNDEIFVIGGAQIYAQAIDIADRLYLTRVDAACDADSFFPEYPQFTRVLEEITLADGGYRLTFLTLERER